MVDADILAERIRAHRGNEKVLAFLDHAAAPIHLRPFHGMSFDEGGVALFERYGAAIPEECKWSLETHNVMVHPRTGLIFALHTGRFTFLLRRDHRRAGTTPESTAAWARWRETLDGAVDIRALDPEWCIWSFEDEESREELSWAYEHAGSP